MFANKHNLEKHYILRFVNIVYSVMTLRWRFNVVNLVDEKMRKS